MTEKYSKADIERMQREAERRVRDMHERAKSATGDALHYPSFVKPVHSDEEPKKRLEREVAAIPPKKAGGILSILDFKKLDLDSDRIMLLFLLILMSGEESDELMTLALLYIML